MLEISRCRPDQIQELMQFLDSYWQSKHVLSTSQELMDWQHLADDGHYNYLLAKSDGQILGVLGYIPTVRFDPRTRERNVVWLALWKVREDAAVSGLGLRLLNALSRVQDHAAIAVNGINLTHPPMYRALGFQVVELTQHFLVNPAKQHALIQAPQGWAASPPVGGDTVFTEVTLSQIDAVTGVAGPYDVLPPKTPAHFKTRFLQHPFYRYRVFRLRAYSGRAEGLLALRVAQHGSHRALRIVDFAGEAALLASCGLALERIMQEEDAEYADFWEFGLPQGLLPLSGFSRIDPSGDLVVPNYFEPYLPRNGRILCAFKNKGAFSFQVFRADGDQDRPNRVPAAS